MVFSHTPYMVKAVGFGPFFHSWPRFLAVVANVYKVEALYFRTWKTGVMFGMSVYKSRGQRILKNKNSAPIIGSNLAKSDADRSVSQAVALVDSLNYLTVPERKFMVFTDL